MIDTLDSFGALERHDSMGWVFHHYYYRRNRLLRTIIIRGKYFVVDTRSMVRYTNRM